MDGLLEEIPARLFAEWQLYYQLEPFGQERDNLHAALVAKMVYDVAVKREDRGKLKLGDFMLGEPLEAGQPETPEALYQKLRAVVLSLGASDPRAPEG